VISPTGAWSLSLKTRPTDDDLDRYEAKWNCWIVRIYTQDKTIDTRVVRIYSLVMIPKGKETPSE